MACMRRFIPLFSAVLLAACSTPAEEPQPPHYVALGDSYAAMGSTTLPLDPPNTCVRAQDSYPELAAKEMDAKLTNVACQGASTLDVLSSAGEHPAQVDALREDTDLVSLSIGGNDASFVRLTQCATDDICQAESGAQIDLEIRDLPRRLDKVYEEIHHRSPNAKVLATGYLPLIKPGETCPYIEKIPATDREWLAESIERINQAVREAAERDARADRRHVQRVAQRAAELGVERRVRGGIAVDEDQAAWLQLRHERRQSASVAQALHVDVQQAAPHVCMHRVAHQLGRDRHGRRRRWRRSRCGIKLRLLLGLESLALREPARRIDPLAVAVHAALALNVREQAEVHRIPSLAAEENVERHVVRHDGRHVVVRAVRLVRVLVRVSSAVHRAHRRRRRRHTLHVRTKLVARERHLAAQLQRQVATDAHWHADMASVPCLDVRLRRVPAVPQRAPETRRIAPRGKKDHRLRVAQELGQQLARQPTVSYTHLTLPTTPYV